MALHITSLKNPRVKNLIALQKPKERKALGMFSVEGVREISLAQQAGYKLESVWICEDIFKSDPSYPVVLENTEVITASKDVFEKLAYREGTEGVIAVVYGKSHTLDGLRTLPKSRNGLYLLLEGIEKPGNIGAMLRTADAAGVNGVILSQAVTDLYNPNVIRSSVGTVFTLQIAIATPIEALNFFRESGIKILATSLTAKKAYHQVDMSGSVAMLMGSEANGLSEFWLQNADEMIVIPMRGKIDSMNVSNATAIVLFEAVRQQLEKPT